MRLVRTILLIAVLTLPNLLGAQNYEAKVDSIIESMTLREKIGQLFMIAAYSNRDEEYEVNFADTIREYKPGSIVFFQGSPYNETRLLNDFQKASDIPMLVAMDAEWGVAMRIDSVVTMPRFMALAATNDSALIYHYGRIVGEQCRRLGVHVNFAPVVDVNSNPLNPVINYRSLGENQHHVAEYARIFCKGMLSAGVLPVAKHFPGHGNTSKDSHFTLPEIPDNRAVFDSVHLMPFREMVNDDIWGIMVAHVYAPALDNTYLLPSSLSRKIIHDLLKEEMGYDGLVITDALKMKGVTRGNKVGSIEVQAYMAGNDLLLMPKDLPIAMDSMEAAVLDGRISEADIDESVRKVLLSKYELRLFDEVQVPLANLTNDLNKPEYYDYAQAMFDKAVTLVYDHDSLVPFAGSRADVPVVSFYIENESSFHREAKKYARIHTFFIPDPDKTVLVNEVLNKVSGYDTLILCVHQMNYWTRDNYKFTADLRSVINRFATKHKVILCLMGNPYAFRSYTYANAPRALIVGYERNQMAEISIAKALFGAIPFQGKLPVTVSQYFPAATGLQTHADVLREARPEDLGIKLDPLAEIDSIVQQAIRDTAMPGCQIMAIKDGVIFYNKSFGYHTYDSLVKVENSHLYDLASLTKMLATTLAVMKLYENGTIELQAPLSSYLSVSQGTDVGELHLDRILTHSSGLPPWRPFHLHVMNKPDLNPYWVATEKSETHSVQICKGLFIRPEFSDTIVQRILRSTLKPDQGYKYSDLGFILLKFMVEDLTGKDFETYLNETFYYPLGLNSLMYNPTRKFDLSVIPPTEEDTFFRDQRVQGFVHDQNASLFGGVAGHAGLFSNAYDIAVIMQMLMQGGKYAGKQYLKTSTILKFTSTYFDKNRRGLGFDKSVMRKYGNACIEASARSYGHSGFTGTYVWSDPDNGLIYIFLSNRTYPDAENKKIVKENIRTRIHSLFYEAVSQD